MQPSSPYRPRVSRETRYLLTAGVLAVAALWLFARIRFQDLPVTPNPVPSVLSQLGTGTSYDALANEAAELQSRLQPSLVALPLSGRDESAARPSTLAAIRLRDDLAVTVLSGAATAAVNVEFVARDPASGLAVVRIPQVPGSAPVTPWTPRRLQQPRYLMASTPSGDAVTVRPVYVASLAPVVSPLWGEPVWSVPAGTDVTPGSFLFTNNAELVGLALDVAGEVLLVPGATVLAEAAKLSTPSNTSGAGVLGIQVQPMTDELSAMTGSLRGVVVTWVQPAGPASGHLAVGDAIEAVDGRPLASVQDWELRLARVAVGDTLSVRARRRGEPLDATLVAAAPSVPASTGALGLSMRTRRGIGAEILGVQRGSAGERAGLRPGDVITLAGDTTTPSPAQVTRMFSSMSEGQFEMVAVTRGERHFVTTLAR